MNRPITHATKIGRNNLCPCKSGKKYKKCCGLEKSIL
ncbi:MAG: SEC-C metal-binding domain-containing protein [Chlamydiales bacterium]